ncbi:hypothetical protein LTS17_003318 [Exophiala oligosperma]
MAGHVEDAPLGRDAYVRTTPFSDKHLLVANRVALPPPRTIWPIGQPTATLSVEQWDVEHTTDVYGDPGFLTSLNKLQKLGMEHTMDSWTYEDRRVAQNILPFLFLGPVSAAKDPDFIRRAGITLVIAMRSSAAVKTRPNFLHPSTVPSMAGLQTMTCDAEASYDLFPKLRPTIKGMNDHLQATCSRMPIQAASDVRGRIFVYLFGVSAISALQVVQSRRFSIAPDDAAKQMLVNFEGLVEAERQVSGVDAVSVAKSLSRQNENTPGPASRPAKRGYHEFDDSDVDMDESNEVETITRQGIAPYADSYD